MNMIKIYNIILTGVRGIRKDAIPTCYVIE